MHLSTVKKYKLCAVAIFVAAAAFIQCSSKKDVADAKRETEKLFRKQLKKDKVRNAYLRVFSPSLNIDWEFVGGKFKNGEAVTAANPFYTASIGKTFTATAIAILSEQNKLNFNDEIRLYLSPEILENLHVYNGKDYSGEITIAQLLQHTSGLPDYFEGETNDGSPNLIEQIFAEPNKFWDPEETIQFAKEKMKPLFAPGTSYNYTDTGYVLLGLIIENLSGLSLPEFFRNYYFEPLGMKHTSMYMRSEPIEKTGKPAEMFVGDFEASTMTSLSADWAGGGIVSTSGDLIKFQQALFAGEIISPETFKKMQNWIPETPGMEYGFGLRKIVLKKLFPTLPDLTLIGHSGITGSYLFYCPGLDVYLAGTLNQSDEVKNSVMLMIKVLSTIHSIK